MIGTLSLNLQFFFFDGIPKLYNPLPIMKVEMVMTFLRFALLPVTYGLNILGVGWIFCVDPNLDIPCEPLKVFYEHSFRDIFCAAFTKTENISTFNLFYNGERRHKKLQSSGNYFIFIL